MLNDTFRKALSVMKYLANCAANGYAYKWGDKTSADDVKQHFESILADETLGENFWRDVFALSEEEKRALGFISFDSDPKMCIPLWIWECLPDNMMFDGKMKAGCRSG